MVKAELDKCPFGVENHEGCTFYRKGIRIVTPPNGAEEHIPFEACAINIIADCLENLVSRNASLQKEMNQVRNEVSITNQIFSELLNRQKAFEDRVSKIEG